MVQAGEIRFLDILYQRYGNPVSLLNGMLATRRFCGFVETFVELYKNDQLEKTRWEYWLHRVFDQSYQDYVQSLGMNQAPAAPTRKEQIKAVQQSMKILDGLCPAKVGENGAIQDSGNDCG